MAQNKCSLYKTEKWEHSKELSDPSIQTKKRKCEILQLSVRHLELLMEPSEIQRA